MKKIDNLDNPKILDILNRLDFFASFSFFDKKRIADYHANFFVYNKDELLIKEGTIDTHFFILLKGTVKVTKGDNNNILANLNAGEFFGEVTYLTNTPRTANVIANETVIVLKVEQKMLNGLAAEIREKFKDKIIEKLIKRLDQMNKQSLDEKND